MKSDSDPQEQPAPPVDESAEARATNGSQDTDGDGAPRSSRAEGASSRAEAAEGPEVELARLRDRLLRTAADFDNYKKRARRDIMEAERRVQENLLQALVPAFDNLERAAGHAESAQDVKALAEGLNMVLRQFQDALGTLGILRIESLGKPFDPAEHEAVQHIQTDDVPPGAVAQELRAGYRWQDRLIRPALVVVAKAPVKAPAESESESEAISE